MSTLLEEHTSQTTPRTSATTRLRTTMAAMRLSFTWFGTRKSLSVEQKAQAADTFGAEGNFINAGKKLISSRPSPPFAVRPLPIGKAFRYPSPRPAFA